MNWNRTDIETALSAGGGLCIGNELTVAVGALTLLSAAIHKKIPIFAKIDVTAAKNADKSAKSTHIILFPPSFFVFKAMPPLYTEMIVNRGAASCHA